MDQHEAKEIRQIVKKYSRPADRKVIRQCLDKGRVNKRQLLREGVTKKQIMSIFGRLRERLKDFHDGQSE